MGRAIKWTWDILKGLDFGGLWNENFWDLQRFHINVLSWRSLSYFNLKPIAQGSKSSAKSPTKQLESEDKNALLNVYIFSCQHEQNIELKVCLSECSNVHALGLSLKITLVKNWQFWSTDQWLISLLSSGWEGAPTRQTLLQVHVVVVGGEMHLLAGWAHQTLAGEHGHTNLSIVLAGGGVLLDEDQVAHHHLLGLSLAAETRENPEEDMTTQLTTGWWRNRTEQTPSGYASKAAIFHCKNKKNETCTPCPHSSSVVLLRLWTLTINTKYWTGLSKKYKIPKMYPNKHFPHRPQYKN